MSTDDNAEWIAIENALARIYPGEAGRWGVKVRFQDGGPEPLERVVALDAGDHWHYVGFGLTQLMNAPPDGSCGDYELTFRAPKHGEAMPPTWPVMHLQFLARHVVTTRNALMVGDHFEVGSVAGTEEDPFCAVVITRDPTLPESVSSKSMRFGFHQSVGITTDEFQATEAWDSRGMLALMRETNPSLVTDLLRSSMLLDPRVAEAVRAGRERDGSRTGALLITQLAILEDETPGRTVIEIGALYVRGIVHVLPGRVPFGRKLTITTGDVALRFEPGELGLGRLENGITIRLDADAARALAATIRPVRGEYRVDALPGVVFKVVPTPMTWRGVPTGEIIG